MIQNPQISHNLVTSEQNFMKLKINFKQTRATSAVDKNSQNFLVILGMNSSPCSEFSTRLANVVAPTSITTYDINNILYFTGHVLIHIKYFSFEII